MTQGGGFLSEEEAQRIWRRAFDLQAAAVDARSHAPTESSALEPQAGYHLSHILEAAGEVGLAPEFVLRALAEGLEEDADLESRRDTWAERLLGSGPRALATSRRFDCSFDALYAAVHRVFLDHHLTLVDAEDHALEGNLLVFSLPPGGIGTADYVATDLVRRARVEEIRLRVLLFDKGRCVASLTAPLGSARRANLGIGGVLVAGAGLVGGWALGALGAALVIPLGLSAPATAVSIAGATVLGFGVAARLAVMRLRAVHRLTLRRGKVALGRLLKEVGVELRMGRTPEIPSSTSSDVDGKLSDPGYTAT